MMGDQAISAVRPPLTIPARIARVVTSSPPHCCDLMACSSAAAGAKPATSNGADGSDARLCTLARPPVAGLPREPDRSGEQKASRDCDAEEQRAQLQDDLEIVRHANARDGAAQSNGPSELDQSEADADDLEDKNPRAHLEHPEGENEAPEPLPSFNFPARELRRFHRYRPCGAPISGQCPSVRRRRGSGDAVVRRSRGTRSSQPEANERSRIDPAGDRS